MRGGRATGASGVALLLALAGNGLMVAAGTGPSGQQSSTPPPGVAAAASTVSDASVAGRVAVSAVVVQVEIVAAKPRSRSAVEARVSVTNLSAARLPLVVVALAATPTTLTIKPASSRALRELQAGRSTDVTWSLCSTTGGPFVLVATASVDGTVARSAPVSVTLAASSRC